MSRPGNIAAGRPDQALAQLERALSFFEELGLLLDLIRAHNDLANAHQALGNLDRTRWHWQQALDILAELDVVAVEDAVPEDIRKSLAET